MGKTLEKPIFMKGKSGQKKYKQLSTEKTILLFNFFQHALQSYCFKSQISILYVKYNFKISYAKHKTQGSLKIWGFQKNGKNSTCHEKKTLRCCQRNPSSFEDIF